MSAWSAVIDELLPDGPHRPVRVSAALLREALRIRLGVLQDLRLHGLIHLLFTHANGMGGADVGAGGHSGHVGGKEYDRSGGRGPCAGRIDVNDHGHARLHNRFNDLPHGRVEAARRVELYQERLGLAVFCLFYGIRYKLRNWGADNTVDFNFQDLGSACAFCGRGENEDRAAKEKKEPLHKRLNFFLRASSTTFGTHPPTGPPKLATSFIVRELTKK